MGDDSTPRKVLSLARGREQMYKISSEKGDYYVCNESHILSLKCSNDYNSVFKEEKIIDLSVKDLLKLENKEILCGYKVPINFSEKDVEFDPYFIGYWLGNKSNNDTLHLNKVGTINEYKIDSLTSTNNFTEFLKNNNLLENKYIPHNYLCNSREKRLLLLSGLIESNGNIKDNYILFENDNEKLIENIIFLVRSLGISCYKKNIVNPVNNLPNYEISIYDLNMDDVKIICENKYFSYNRLSNNDLKYKLFIEKLEIDDYYGFEIDGNRRFVLGDFTVTHNTVLSLNIISKLKKKTFIIVHKEFLMNQWIERIQQFLPKAKIGKIQGQIIDIDNKDIVIGMLQSISMKDYPSTIFESFGLTIIDEVHHISSEVFSNSLFKIVTKYMLGLSATMNRKDGTTNVFKMFLGDIIFKGKRDEERDVTVRAIEYKVDDDEFNEVKTDFRGNPAYSSMISKLCEYNHRSEFILKVLSDMIKENSKQQIMILAHNKCLLKYLHDAIQHRHIATVGYYIGGMKEAELKNTESKTIVIATYSMASEALDIKTLTTLIMATPKTDIEQSVGRILREKHNDPVVVDIIDSHDLFKNQWRKRKTFYKKENYKIIYTNSKNYIPNTNVWDLVYEPEKNKKTIKTCAKKKNISSKSSSSTDKSIAEDSDSDTENYSGKNTKYSEGICLLQIKKLNK